MRDTAYLQQLSEPIRSALVAAYESGEITHARLTYALDCLDQLKDKAAFAPEGSGCDCDVEARKARDLYDRRYPTGLAKP